MLMDLAALFIPQNRRLVKLTTPLQSAQELLLDHFTGGEGLSRLFSFNMGLISQDAHIELKSLIGKPALLEIELADGGTRPIHGYITRFASNGSDGGLAHYSATLSPWLWMLGRRFDSRIFQDQTVEQVITQVFSPYGALPKFEFRLSKALKPHSYITQYRESDLNFVQRLLDNEGLFYYFEHTNEQHTLVVMDDSTLLKPLPAQPRIRYHSAAVTESADSITGWSGQRQLQSGRVAMQTFDYKQPGNLLQVGLDSVNQQGDVEAFEIFDFPGQYTHGTHDDGEALVRNRLEALEVQAKLFYGASNCRGMSPGYTFELLQHYDHDNDSADDRQFLLLGVQHGGSNNYLTGDEAHYTNEFTCIRRKIPYRPTLSAERPRISGPQTAIVVGPPGEEIFTDSLGRVKLQFHWDRYGQRDDKSSCWVRVAQAWASGGFGSIQIPRVGDEVVVSFLDGNPDRPLVTGSLYNSQNMPPWSLPENKTQSGFLTRSTKSGAAAANFIRFEDKQGAEQVIIHAERFMDTEVELDETHSVGNNRSITVGGTHTETIKKDTLVNVQEGAYTLVVGQQHIQIEAKTHIILRVGNSSITLTPEAIEIQADAIHTLSKGETFVEGQPVRINK
ncbi:type VI secretion system Vgr family protein [Pseudomonas sp. 273]|uniref:type VI secretion system Vgr family protein n=1 Tax=Pseudomonas sp. 273 TaxID=75692 RepID=UPI0023D8C954|nr:type VI secretion system Vgr family protein [Pseudomonas sp. 273]